MAPCRSGWRDIVFAHLAIERRAADAKPAGDLAHPSAILDEGQANEIGLDILQTPHIAFRIVQRDRGRGPLARLMAGERVRFAGIAEGRDGGEAVAHVAGRRLWSPVARAGPPGLAHGDDRTEIGRLQHLAIGQHHGPVNGIFQLPDIARPVEALQKIDRSARQAAGRRLGLALGKAGQKLFGKRANLRRPIAQSTSISKAFSR